MFSDVKKMFSWYKDKKFWLQDFFFLQQENYYCCKKKIMVPRNKLFRHNIKKTFFLTPDIISMEVYFYRQLNFFDFLN